MANYMLLTKCIWLFFLSDLVALIWWVIMIHYNSTQCFGWIEAPFRIWRLPSHVYGVLKLLLTTFHSQLWVTVSPYNYHTYVTELTTISLGPDVVPIWCPCLKAEKPISLQKNQFCKGEQSLRVKLQVVDTKKQQLEQQKKDMFWNILGQKEME